MDIGLALLRLAVGLTLAAHGAQKLFGWFGGPGIEGAARGLERLGFVPGRRQAVTAGLVEFVGGLFLGLGFLTPLAAAIVFAVMLVAGVSAHAKHGFFLAAGGYEYTLILAAAGLSLAFTGPGALSLDALLGLHLEGVFWGTVALFAGLAGGALPLAGRRREPMPQTAS